MLMVSGYRLAAALICRSPLSCDALPGEVRRAFYRCAATGQDVLNGAGLPRQQQQVTELILSLVES